MNSDGYAGFNVAGCLECGNRLMIARTARRALDDRYPKAPEDPMEESRYLAAKHLVELMESHIECHRNPAEYFDAITLEFAHMTRGV